MADNLLNDEDYLKILQARFQTENIELVNAEIQTFSENIEGFMGDHYNLAITYKIDNEENTENFFIKTKPRKSVSQRATASVIYVKEVYVYEKLLKEFEKFGCDTNFAPKCFYIKDGDIIVMENLLDKGFKLLEKKKFLDLHHIKAALQALASFHANSIAYEEMKSEELGRTFKSDEENPEAFKPTLFVKANEDSPSELFLNSSIQCFLKMSTLLEKSEDWLSNFEKRLLEFDCTETFNEALPYRTTCSHGDLWSNNMLFKYDNDIPTKCTLVDFQLLRHFHPAYDVGLLLYSTTRREFRKMYQDDLIHFYYDTFSDILKQHGLDADDILMKEDFLTTFRHFEPVALMQAASQRTVFMLPLDVTNSSVESQEGFQMLMFKKERVDIVVLAFQKDELFRNLMTDDILDFDELFSFVKHSKL